MNCKCLEEIPKTVIQVKDYKGKKVTSCKIKETSFQLAPKVTQFTFSTLVCEIEGRKTPVNVTFAHSFCPFCGTKIELETKS